MNADADWDPVLRPFFYGYFGRRGRLALSGRCDACGRHVRLASFDAREWIRIGPLPLFPLRRFRVIDACPLCGHLRRLPLEDYLTWTEGQVAAERAALAAAPSDTEARLALVWKLYGLGRVTEAAALAVPWLAADAESAAAQHAAGVLLRAVGRHNEALQAFRGSVTREPHNPVYQLDLGRALAVGGRHLALAAHHLETAARLDPKDAEVWRLLAEVRGRRRDWTGADEAWQRAAAIDRNLERLPSERRRMQFARLMAHLAARRGASPR